MARVNVEESAIAIAALMATNLGVCKDTLLGCLVTLWSVTQNAQLTSASAKTIGSFFKSLDEKHPLIDLLSELEQHQIINKLDNGNYEIIGNNKHIQKYLELKALAKKGGRAAASSARFKRTVQAHASNEVQAPATAQCNAVQFNAVQFNSIQNKTKEKEEKNNTTAIASQKERSLSLVSVLDIETLASEKKLRDAWINRVDLQFVETEEAKMLTWIFANPKRKPTRRGFPRFYNSWLERGFDRHRKSVPANSTANHITAEDIDEVKFG